MNNLETLRLLVILTLLLMSGVLVGIVVLFIIRMVRTLWFRWRMRKFRNLKIHNGNPEALANVAHMLYDAAERLRKGEWVLESGGIMMQPTKNGLSMYSDLKLKEANRGD